MSASLPSLGQSLLQSYSPPLTSELINIILPPQGYSLYMLV